MTQVLSPNTQAILLLTAPLIAGRGGAAPDLLSPTEYKRFARHLRDINRQPADLLAPDPTDLLGDCAAIVDPARLQHLLGRGFLLSQVVERWQTRAIWVTSRADAGYPRRLKARLKDDAPAVLYGCGDIGLADTGGLAVAGSGKADQAMLDELADLGRLAAQAGTALIAGGTRGIDQAALLGTLRDGGRAIGVLADSLEKAAMEREHRHGLINGRLLLISPCDPNAPADPGNAMRRDLVIHALADAALVLSADIDKRGAPASAAAQPDAARTIPVFVRSAGPASGS